jgi:hypothetical protein
MQAFNSANSERNFIAIEQLQTTLAQLFYVSGRQLLQLEAKTLSPLALDLILASEKH